MSLISEPTGWATITMQVISGRIFTLRTITKLYRFMLSKSLKSDGQELWL